MLLPMTAVDSFTLKKSSKERRGAHRTGVSEDRAGVSGDMADDERFPFQALTHPSADSRQTGFLPSREVQVKSTTAPIFCFDGLMIAGNNDVGLMRCLVPVPICRVSPIIMFELEQTLGSMTQMADLVIYPEILRRSYDGGVTLLGFSHGGKMVHTVATGFEALGSKIRGIIAIDTRSLCPIRGVPLHFATWAALARLKTHVTFILYHIREFERTGLYPTLSESNEISEQLLCMYRSYTILFNEDVAHNSVFTADVLSLCLQVRALLTRHFSRIL